MDANKAYTQKHKTRIIFLEGVRTAFLSKLKGDKVITYKT